MKKYCIIYILLTCVLFVACQTQTSKITDSQKSEIEKQIRDISMKWLDLWKSDDLDGQMALFSDNAVVYRQNQEPFIGKSAIRDLYTSEREKNPKRVSNWTTDRVEIADSGDLAIEYGKYSEKGLGMDGSSDDHGNFITVYRKLNGNWKILSDSGTSSKPAELTK